MTSYIIDQQTARVNSGEKVYVPMTLGVNHFSGKGDFNIHSVYVWDKELSADEMKTVTRALRKELGGVPDFAKESVVPISDIRAYYLRFLIALRPPQSINIFADLEGTTVPDRIGIFPGLFPVEVIGAASIVKKDGFFNGANNLVTALAGTTNTKLLWPINSLPLIFTICSVSRYASLNSALQDRILSCFRTQQQTTNCLHGHWRATRGMAYYSDWKTLQNSASTTTDWLIMCGTSGGTAPGNIIIDQVEVGIEMGGNAAASQIHVNMHSSQTSDFNLHSLYVWNAVLSPVQMKHVTSALRAQIGGAPDVAGGGTGDRVTAMVPAPTAYEQRCPVGAEYYPTTGDCIDYSKLCPTGTYFASEDSLCTNCQGIYKYVQKDKISDERYVVYKFVHPNNTIRKTDYNLDIQTCYNVQFPTSEAVPIDLLVVAGGGAGGPRSRESCSGGGSAGEVIVKTGISVSGNVKICVGAGGGLKQINWYIADQDNEAFEGSPSTFTTDNDTITTVGGGGGGQGLGLKSWSSGGTGGAYGTGGGASKRGSNCGVDFTGASSVSGIRPKGYPHKGGDSYGTCNDPSPVCGGGGGAGGNGTGPDISGSPRAIGNGGVGVYVSAFDLHVGGGGAGANRQRGGLAYDGGGQYIDDNLPHGVDGTGGGGGGSSYPGSSTISLGGYGGSGVVMIRHRTGIDAMKSMGNVIECDTVCSVGCRGSATKTIVKR